MKSKKGSSSKANPPSSDTGDSIPTGGPDNVAKINESQEKGLLSNGESVLEKNDEDDDLSSVLSSEATHMDLDSTGELSPTISDSILTSESRDHYHYVPSKNGSRESFNLSTRVDNGTSNVHEEPIVYNESSRLGSDKRRYLSGEIARLKNELFDCVMHGIAKDDTTVEAKRLTAVTLKLEKAEKAFKLLFGQETTLVPADLPLFQWKGHVFNNNKASFNTVEDCLDQFERILFAHSLSLEDNWRRLVPARLSTTMVRSYAKQAANDNFSSWKDFCIEVSNKYGKSLHSVKEEARE